MPLILHAQFVTGLFLERITLDLRISYCSKKTFMSITDSVWICSCMCLSRFLA